MNMNFQLGSCPVCGQMHDDGGWVTRETGERQFVCHDCLDSVYEEPKWRRGDRVLFTTEIGDREGVVDIVDRGGAWGVFGHSYDIDGTDGVLYKHVPQRNVRGPRA